MVSRAFCRDFLTRFSQRVVRSAGGDGIEEVAITVHPGQDVVPLPEGWQYLGFIFARAETPDAVEQALRQAHARLHFAIE